MLKWTEVNVYSGRPVEEDAPTNFWRCHVDGIGVGPQDPGWTKEKRLLDARTKEYKQHAREIEDSPERMSSKLMNHCCKDR